MQKDRKTVKQDKIITVQPTKQSQGSLVLPPGLWRILWALSPELRCRYWNPHQWEEVNCLLPASLQAHGSQAGRSQMVDNVDSWLPHHPPIGRLSTSWSCTPQSPSLTPSLKTFPWKPSRSWGLWALASWTPCLESCDTRWTLLGVCALPLLPAGEWTQVWFLPLLPNLLLEKLKEGLPWGSSGWESTYQSRGLRFDPWSGN